MTENGDGHSSPPWGPSPMLEQRVRGLPSSSAAPPKSVPRCSEPWGRGGHTPRCGQPLPRSSCSFLAVFVAIL